MAQKTKICTKLLSQNGTNKNIALTKQHKTKQKWHTDLPIGYSSTNLPHATALPSAPVSQPSASCPLCPLLRTLQYNPSNQSIAPDWHFRSPSLARAEQATSRIVCLSWVGKCAPIGTWRPAPFEQPVDASPSPNGCWQAAPDVSFDSHFHSDQTLIWCCCCCCFSRANLNLNLNLDLNCRCCCCCCCCCCWFQNRPCFCGGSSAKRWSWVGRCIRPYASPRVPWEGMVSISISISSCVFICIGIETNHNKGASFGRKQLMSMWHKYIYIV